MDNNPAGIIAGDDGQAPPPPVEMPPLPLDGPDPFSVPLGPGGRRIRRSDGTDPLCLEAHGFGEAVRLLLLEEDGDRSPIDHLRVVEAPGFRPSVRHDAPSFRRFVSLLEKNGRTVRNITLNPYWTGLPEEDLERLFGAVLPRHQFLQGIEIWPPGLPSRFLRRLTESIPTAAHAKSLTLLSIRGWSVDREQAEGIAAMLNRNVALTDLHLYFELDPDQCKLVCQAMRRNTNLRYLLLRVKKIFADTLDGVAASSLRELNARGAPSDGAVSSFARQLRTNETLQVVDVSSNGARDSQVLLDLVKTYNHKLRRLDGGHLESRHTLQEYTRRNGRIRTALAKLQAPDPASCCLVAPPRLLPSVLGLVSDVPTALYRLLRMGYVHAVSDLISAPATATTDAQVPHRRRSARLAKRRRIAVGAPYLNYDE